MNISYEKESLKNQKLGNHLESFIRRGKLLSSKGFDFEFSSPKNYNSSKHRTVNEIIDEVMVITKEIRLLILLNFGVKQ